MRYEASANREKREITVQEHLDLVLASDINVQVLDKESFLRAVDQYLAQQPVRDLLEV